MKIEEEIQRIARKYPYEDSKLLFMDDIRWVVEQAVKENINEFQDIVKGYFDNVLELPCPDFTLNLKNFKK
jgi:hypothetical protein